MRGTNHRFSCYLRLGHCLGLLLFLLPILSCNPGGSKKLNRRVTLWRKDKIPYGTFIAYENLPYLFPDAEVSINQVSPSELKSPANGKQVGQILIGNKGAVRDLEIGRAHV